MDPLPKPQPNLQPNFSTHYFDYLRSVNADYIDDLYTKYKENPDSIDPTWRFFFDGVFLGEASVLSRAGKNAGGDPLSHLTQAYRNYGHLIAQTNPLYPAPAHIPELELARLGLNEDDVKDETVANGFARLKKIYCGSVGVELLQIQSLEERSWVEQRIESLNGDYSVSAEDKKFILNRLSDSEGLERFIHTRYVAQKRFSIEGGEALIPGLSGLVETAAQKGAQEIVIGMAHRGRLNVMVNILGKSPEALFTEFDDNYRLSADHGEGDVKYHKGHSLDFTTRQGKRIHLSLGFNPSHLEFIDPVIMGMARAKQLQRKDEKKEKVLTISIHGDSAFAGQGVVYETLQASQLNGYSVGGTIHIISNNQVGFTTDPQDSRSTRYCTDLARMLDAPIFHVNGDDPEALWHVVQIATEYRYQFKKDVVIDLVCYRRYGHNEGDEPAFTQPALYRAIAEHSTPRDLYTQKLIREGLVSEDEAKAYVQKITDTMSAMLEKVRNEKPEPAHSEYRGTRWSKYLTGHLSDMLMPIQTGINAKELIAISQKINRFAPPVKIHPKLERLFEGRLNAIEQGKGIDWGNAEVLAYASLVHEGSNIRMSGQDVCRGTFTHRHATIIDNNTNLPYIGINELHPSAKLYIYNSYLSETAVMGYEFGWSIADPDSLVVWEAQFGDFANGAQVIIDQFLSTSESKWHRASGLVLLLPHGFEGQAAEHSSARLERFLQLCGKANMSVVNPTTPAQIFHLLRRQVKRAFRKPLIVMTPKSLLRNPKAVSELRELSEGTFQEILDDPLFQDGPLNADPLTAERVTRVMICCGKIYYDLLEEKEKRNIQNVALIRLEQPYPWPEERLARVLEKYFQAKEIFYVQEEPRNMGAWVYFQGMWGGALSDFGSRFPKLKLKYIGREICASPAVGSKKLHDKEQREIVLKAFQD